MPATSLTTSRRIDNITIATRGHRTVHIVADQWDEGGMLLTIAAIESNAYLGHSDHAQWDIKLGEDANLKSVNAKFTGKELRVTGRFLDFTVNQESIADSISSSQTTS